MFDNPQKELDWLAQELLAAEAEESEEPPKAAVPKPKKQKAPEPIPQPLPAAPSRSGHTGLVVAMILETVGLVALIVWWLRC